MSTASSLNVGSSPAGSATQIIMSAGLPRCREVAPERPDRSGEDRSVGTGALPTAVDLDRRMVGKVRSRDREVDDDRDAQLAQVSLRTDTGPQQERRTPNNVCSEDDPTSADLGPVDESDTGRSLARDRDARDGRVCTGSQCSAGPAAGRRRPSSPLARRGAERHPADPDRVGCVVVFHRGSRPPPSRGAPRRGCHSPRCRDSG